MAVLEGAPRFDSAAGHANKRHGHKVHKVRGKNMGHIAYCIRMALRHPIAAVNGVREFRTDLTTHYEDDNRMESYDAGRELAHAATLRRFDPCVY